jgi:hypothetical protein
MAYFRNKAPAKYATEFMLHARECMSAAIQRELLADPEAETALRRNMPSIRKIEVTNLREGLGSIYGPNRLVMIAESMGLRFEFREKFPTGVTQQ